MNVSLQKQNHLTVDLHLQHSTFLA